jgi:TfoX/Sxy family transcriptional regulator of competence genes
VAYDEALALRVRSALADRKNIDETKMFGGICFMLNGNMLCGVDRARLMFRVGKDQAAEALSRPGARPMDITGKPMTGFVFVDPAKCDARQLKSWIALGENYVGALPAKNKKKKPKDK